MKLRGIIILLAAVTFLSVAIGGYAHYLTLYHSVHKNAHIEAEKSAAETAGKIDISLHYYRGAVKALASIDVLEQALYSGDPSRMDKANATLDSFNAAMNADVCYLMDLNGNTVASSNRNSSGSFVGKNYAFRPYFKEALKGNPSVYMALGVTSNKRGIYFSFPVYTDPDDPPSGVAVMKTSIMNLEEYFRSNQNNITLLTGPDEIIFISSIKEMLYNSLWEQSPAWQKAVTESRQFGKGPWEWAGYIKGEGSNIYDRNGNHYDIALAELEGYPGWDVVIMQNHHNLSDTILKNLKKRFGILMLCVLLLTGAFSLALYLIANREITKRTAAEQEAKKVNKELEQVIHVTSHDLRSPLVNIQGYSREVVYSLEKIEDTIKAAELPDTLKEKATYIIEQDIPDSVRHIDKSLKKMDSLLAGLLQLSRSGRVKLEKKKLDMNKLVSDAVSTLGHCFKDSGAVYKISELSPCYGGEGQLNQVFTNLIGNALKYLDPQRPGVVRVFSRDSDGMTDYCVEDNGVGISEDDREEIFSIFYQVNPQKEGEGLGLNIVKKIVEMHGGKVWVESELGKGSTFCVSLPKKR